MQRSRLEGIAIGGVRILTGLMWLANLHWKVPTDFGRSTGGGLYKYVAEGAQNAPFAPYQWGLREIVLPNFQLFGWFTLITELVVAALLLIGYRTRIVALAGAAMAVPIMLSVLYYSKADEWSWSYLLMIGVHLLLAAVYAGNYLGVDGVIAGPSDRARLALRASGIVAVAVGVAGLFVARAVNFSGDLVKLLGSDAGFVDGDQVVRRWELKFLWFNPLWAVLTIVFGALLIFGAHNVKLAWTGTGGFALIAIIAFFQQTFDYLRDDGSVQRVATASNVAVWGGFALAAALFIKHFDRSTVANE